MSARGTAARRGGGDGDQGHTLVELLVGMTLLMVIGTMLLLTFNQGMGAVFTADARTADAQQAKRASENVTKALRTAVDPDGGGPLQAFEVAGPEDVLFYAALGNRSGTPAADTPPRKVRIYREGSTLLQRTVLPVTASGVTTWPGSGTVRTIATDVLSGPGTEPVFTYLAASDTGATSTGRAVSSLPVTAGAVTTAQGRAAIGAVEVWVSIDSSSKREATTSVSRVTLLNKEL